MHEVIQIDDPSALLSVDGRRAVESFQFRIKALHLPPDEEKSVLRQFAECFAEVAADCYAAGIEEGERRVIERAREIVVDR